MGRKKKITVPKSGIRGRETLHHNKHDSPRSPNSAPLSHLLLLELEETVVFEGKKMTNKQAIAKKVVSMGVNGDKWSIEFIFNRIEGKPIQQMNIGGEIPNSFAEFLLMGLESGKTVQDRDDPLH